MLTLRILLGAILVFFCGGYFVLATVARGFRQSFGASPLSILVVILPIAGMVLLIAALIFSAERMLLHVAAGAAVGLVGFCIWQIVSEGAGVLVLALIVLAAWFYYYWAAIHMAPAVGS